MYVHGELLFPDYIAIALFLLTTTFLLSCLVYGILDPVGFRFRLPKLSLNRFYCLGWIKWELDLRHLYTNRPKWELKSVLPAILVRSREV